MAARFTYVPAGEGPTWNLMGEVEVFKRTGEDYSFFETISQPQNGAPLHIHPEMDEVLYVLDGEFLVQADEQKLTVRTGDFVHFPKGTPHGYKNAGAQPGRLLFLCTPGGYEKFFEAMSQAVAGGPPDMETLMQVARDHGSEIVGPLP